MAPRSDLILFIDLEATGSNKNGDDSIMEVGCSLLDGQTLEEIGFYHSVVSPPMDAWQRMMENDVVRDMHEESGLLTAQSQLGYRELYEADRIDKQLVEWLRKFIGTDTTHVPYGGSGVAWYDRPLIRREFPLFDKRISYWAFDTAAIRRTALLAGRTDWPQQTFGDHRALHDARHAAAEFRFAVELLRPHA